MSVINLTPLAGHPQPCVKQSPGVIVSALFFTTARGVLLGNRNLGDVFFWRRRGILKSRKSWIFISKMFGNEKNVKIIPVFFGKKTKWEALQQPHNLNYEPSTWIDVDLKPIWSGKNSWRSHKSYAKSKEEQKKHRGLSIIQGFLKFIPTNPCLMVLHLYLTNDPITATPKAVICACHNDMLGWGANIATYCWWLRESCTSP